ncbi:deoxyribose-phosphate aldolase/phospho-2-dehydro- 3-deoxyheptonate aldolase [Candidatus Aquiluna sp. IMCC13023]|uniref:class I fructose-bisphosphate aldolase n=1 Tax=Candidatus Aquiluna sp. IMCC13023 TaxID=1081644 RepID=UPI00025B236E|nr:aldolase [Candidatus Aquiluna sp. IMCC13023]EIC91937.1 deoxyribose-phosphate aldolase/phospho-2-dehydro- 3-deoxyheptonate aldolase [Candidatus Aquiluna sp. IMCC13023]
MTSYRLNRLFNPKSGRALDVAIDHGFFGEPTFLKGIESIDNAVSALIAAGPDAIQLTVGQARVLQSVPGKQKPALVLRTDIANVYGVPLDDHLYSHHFPDAVEEAVRLDAVCVVANLIQLPGRPEIREANIQSIMALRKECVRYNMPLMVEPLVMQENSVNGAYMVDGDTRKIVSLVRQARELGADLIKADPTSNVEDYHLVIEAAGDLPVLVRGGGGSISDRALLERTVGVLDQGAKGLVYGRNIVQHRDPVGITKAMMAILHDGSSVDDALLLIAGE